MNKMLKEACEKYNPDADIKSSSRGAYGHYLADRLLAEQKNKETSGSFRNLEKIAWIALSSFSELDVGESVGASEIKVRLRALKKAGYDVPKYGGLNKLELSNLFFRKIKADVTSRIRKECPGLYWNIQRENQRQKDEADFCR